MLVTLTHFKVAATPVTLTVSMTMTNESIQYNFPVLNFNLNECLLMLFPTCRPVSFYMQASSFLQGVKQSN